MQPMSVKHEAGAKSGNWAHCLLAVCKRVARHCVHRRSSSFHAVQIPQLRRRPISGYSSRNTAMTKYACLASKTCCELLRLKQDDPDLV